VLPYTPAADARPCCGRVNRGLAIFGNTLYVGTLDAHLLAIDAQTGKLLWNVEVAKSSERYTITQAPLVVKDKILLGTAGGDGPIRGFIAAFDATTGKEVWRFYTIPGVGEPGNETWSGDSWKTGGAGVWNTGAYDPDLNLTYWGIGNPSGEGSARLGDNLYSDSVVALDADTGKLRWHYQFTPHDDQDWDAALVPVLTDIEWEGRARKVMLCATKNGLMYVLDRRTGQFLMGKPFVEVNWMNGFDEKGRPRRVSERVGTENTPIMPRTAATNWFPPSYSPSTGLFYIPSWESVEGSPAAGLTANRVGDTYAALRAFDPATGEKKWEFMVSQTRTLFSSGALSTASGLLFTGASNKHFYALDARTGELLWKMSLAGAVSSGPISYSVGGRQYIAVAAGNTLFALTLDQ
jgi:alcohol dehydrogenase (cytochrome c)